MLQQNKTKHLFYRKQNRRLRQTNKSGLVLRTKKTHTGKTQNLNLNTVRTAQLGTTEHNIKYYLALEIVSNNLIVVVTALVNGLPTAVG